MLRRLTNGEFYATVAGALPSVAAAMPRSLSPQPISKLGFDNDAALLVVNAVAASEISDMAREVADLATVPAALATLLPCSGEANLTCAGSFLDTVGARLFRRALTAAERTRYLELHASVAARSDFRTALGWVLTALLQSPSTVYRSELGVVDGGVRRLTRPELASELAYAFTGGPPSPALAQRAEAGELDSPEARLAAARELLATASGQQTLLRFFAEWSDYARVAVASRPHAANFDAIKASMLLETPRFLREVVIERRGGVRELLTAPYTFVDQNLAVLYGFGQSSGELTLAQRPPGTGIGLLAQGALLAGRAHVDASSPTLRGLFVYERLLCNARPLPPPGIPAISSPSPGVSTTRQRYEIHHAASPTCQTCHQLFDPMGFGLEHFDELGRYRADEAGLAIDATGTLPQSSLHFAGAEDLALRLAEQPEVNACLSGLLASYWFGGAGGVTCLAEDAREAFASGQIGFSEFTVRLAAAPSATTRSLR